MKKLLTIFIFLFSAGHIHACDICGCGVGGYYIGILPEFHKHIIGIRYRYNSLQTHIGAGGNITYLTTAEMYRTAELWGGWNLGKKFRIMAALPYAFNERENLGTVKTKNGLGDISVNAYYQVLNSQSQLMPDKLLVQTLWIGGGIKLPTGQYVAADKMNTSQNTNLFQLGTASTDFTLNAMYDARLQDFGVNISASYKMNTANSSNYNYGNKLNVSAQAYYKIRVMKKYTIAPNAGIIYERSKKDIDNKIIVDVSGGRLLMGGAGLEVSGKKISAGANWQTPLSQNLANGFVKSNNRMMLHVSFLL